MMHSEVAGRAPTTLIRFAHRIFALALQQPMRHFDSESEGFGKAAKGQQQYYVKTAELPLAARSGRPTWSSI